MSADLLQTDRDERITLSEIHHILTQLRDEQYLIRRTLDALLEQTALTRQEVIAVDYNKRQGL